MKHVRLAIPLVREAADIRSHHSLLDSQANTAIFGGWGVRVGLRVW